MRAALRAVSWSAGGVWMARRVILTVGTKRGLFLLESGTGRKRWKVTGPLLKGWGVPPARGEIQ